MNKKLRGYICITKSPYNKRLAAETKYKIIRKTEKHKNKQYKESLHLKKGQSMIFYPIIRTMKSNITVKHNFISTVTAKF